MPSRRVLPTIVYLFVGMLICTSGPAVLGATGLLEFTKLRQSRRWENVPHHVLAFYYTWYGRPERHGRWVHWNGVRPEEHEIATSTNYPSLGAYDSHDPNVIDLHIDQAKRHGITGWIATWWGQGTFDDRAFASVIKRAALKDFYATVYWETAPGEGERQIQRAVDDLLYILRKYGSEKAFLKVDGKPVIFVYGRVMTQVPRSSWPEIITRVEKQWDKGFLLIADGLTQANARLFDGIHTYNICGWVRDLPPEALRKQAAENFRQAVDTAHAFGKISCVTVIPGYDDTKIRTPGLKALRRNGENYQLLWEEAIRAQPDWVLITSWNEWHEGSEIEPSWEHGDKYLRLTEQFAVPFRKAPTNKVKDSGPTTTSPQSAALMKQYFGSKPIAVLPEFGGDAVFWLVDGGAKLEALDWSDIVDPQQFNAQRFPVALYAGGEHYQRTVHSEGDVVKALQAYLRGGGTLVVLPWQPYPFYYDETGRPNIVAQQLGIPIAGRRSASRAGTTSNITSWETPPEGRSLIFRVNQELLPDLPATIPFPATGDLRWRPASREVVSSDDRYESLIRLVDDQGRYYGDGAAFVHYQSGPLRSGKVLYVWMSLADDGDLMWRTQFDFLAKQLHERR